MKNQALHRILGIIGGTIFSIGAGLAVTTPKAEAAVLTYNFQATTTGWTAGTYDGYFKFDNSSLTGIGEEVVGISEGIFNFVGADNQPLSYSLRSSRAFLSIFVGEGLMSQVDVAAYILNGDFIGLSIARLSEFPIASVPRLINDGVNQFTTSGNLRLKIDPYTDVIQGHYAERQSRLFNLIIPYQGTVTYTGPARAVGDITSEPIPEPVPEPMTVAGTALALAGLAAVKHKKNRQQLE